MKIEAGTMVWCRDIGSLRKWAGPYEYIGDHYQKGYAVWSEGKSYVAVWDGVTATDPHEPKQPDFIPEGHELWKTKIDGSRLSALHYENPEGTCLTDRPRVFNHCFHSFAVQSGDGGVYLMNGPVWYTVPGTSTISDKCRKDYVRAVILGCVMRKQ